MLCGNSFLAHFDLQSNKKVTFLNGGLHPNFGYYWIFDEKMKQNQNNKSNNKPRIGTRIITPKHRVADMFAREFTPDDNFDRFEPIHILKRIGTKLPHSASKPKWTQTLIAHLELLVSMTQEHDWIEGKPIVWLSVTETADQLGVSNSQVNYNEKMLFKLGALTWTDSGNHKRYGKRDERGRIITAYGVNLAPLGQLTRFLRQSAESIERERMLWRDSKTAFAGLRRKIRGVFAAVDQWRDEINAEQTHFDDLIKDMSIKRHTRIEEIKDWSAQLMTFLERLDLLQTPQEVDDNPVDKFVVEKQNAANMRPLDPIYTTPGSNELDAHRIPKINNYNKYKYCSGAGDAQVVYEHPDEHPAEANDDFTDRNCHERGGGQIDEAQQADPDRGSRIREVVNLSKFYQSLPQYLRNELGTYTDWRDVINLAERLCSQLGISSYVWQEACKSMGQAAAALIIIVIEVKHQRGIVRSPSGYLFGMIKKSKKGLLDLMPSIYGIQAGS